MGIISHVWLSSLYHDHDDVVQGQHDTDCDIITTILTNTVNTLLHISTIDLIVITHNHITSFSENKNEIKVLEKKTLTLLFMNAVHLSEKGLCIAVHH